MSMQATSVFEQTHNHYHLIQTKTMQSCQSETFYQRIANILYFPCIYYSRITKKIFNKTKNLIFKSHKILKSSNN